MQRKDAAKEETAAAKELNGLVESYSKSTGRLEQYGDTLVFYAPRNFTGSTLSYRVVISSNEFPEYAMNLDITMKPEEDKLRTAYDNLISANAKAAMLEAARLAREANEKANEALNAGNSLGDGGGGTAGGEA